MKKKITKPKEPKCLAHYEVWVAKPMSVFQFELQPSFKKVRTFVCEEDARFFADYLRIVKDKHVRLTKSWRIGLPLSEGDQ